ncbi:MAG TPA: hypothetical protein DEF00_03065 [Candidatus Taylorbacteria bacterium]|nr:MAG: hypothetical protein UY03_C0003G0024 [Parcubacteria group bacterium GW2011_GWA2_47_64]KKU96811.1 MAG: hypothetical protein UY29_C0006G0020 [Parcubacteria group bacterium GW2011_GWC2_48_17]HBV01346.1 hypothetical protein [Candidatus Taylorbacteria bacterium]
MSRKTKTIIAVAVVLLLIALGVFLYFLWNKKPVSPDLGGTFPPPTDEIAPEEKPPVTLPEEVAGPFEPILRQLSKVPIAGAVLGVKSGEAVVRYQERATGNIYEIGAAGEGEKRLTNTTIPKVYEALWSKTGTELVSRYVRENSEIIESFSARVIPESSGKEGELQGVFLPRDISSAAIAPDGKKVFYLQGENGGASGIQSDLSGNGKTKIWASPVREWLVSWPAANKIAILSKPSGFASGMLISLDPLSGARTLVLRNIPGLTALMNPAKSLTLYSASSESNISLHMLDTATGRNSTVRTTTFPEKCVWSKNGESFYCGVPKIIPPGTYPDVWYQGVIAFEDEVWGITPSSGVTDRVLDISGKRGIPIDLINPEVSPDEKFLIFTDKESGTLWSLQMKP